ncbi:MULTISPECIES: ABC transporter substrate-binding protein [Streptomyces]|uniref:ABC transporter substrate-binding protein n=1 Tax=Streptomyces TaxID=1883 RepID=UPI0002F92648|nr:ABC transporter substrate-binding protein [Streptomyces tsukubensis]MYS68230.1 ABC transporter substrate-binding protein [Streptomyces sp. SID5473]TAI40663.1 ABC transporter substrate-binding protein [Streptomyces tsukubensis]
MFSSGSAGGPWRRVLIGCLVLAAAVSGCGLPAGAARSADTLVYAVETEPDCLDPQVSPLDATAALVRNTHDSLISMDRGGTFHPWLAERWTRSADGLAYTFRLRPGVRFHDGTRLGASAVRATLDHAVNPKTRSMYAASLLEGYRRTVVVDELTARVELGRPNAAFLQALSTAYLGIQSPRALAKPAGELCTRPVGSGPYELVSWSRKHSITLRRNPDYRWGPGPGGRSAPPRIAEITYLFVAEQSVRLGLLTSGQADAVDNVPPRNVAALRRSSGYEVQRTDNPGLPWTLFLNPNRGPLADVRVRRALTKAIRLNELVDAVYHGQRTRAFGPLSPTTVHHAAGTPWKDDPEEAARLLDAAGWKDRDGDGYRVKDGKRLSLFWPYSDFLARDGRDVMGQGIQAEARRAGFELRYTRLDPGQFATRAGSGDADVLAFSFTRAEPDILRHYFGSGKTAEKGGSNLFRIADPALDGWLDRAITSPDAAVRATAYENAQRYVLDRALAVPVYVPATTVGYVSDLRGLRWDPSGYPVFQDALREDS